MVGQGVLRECLLDANVHSVLSIGRGSSGRSDPKLREVVHTDFLNYDALRGELTGFDACFFCLGVSSAGMTEERYRAITYDYTLAAARTLVALNLGMTFIYVSGMGTDSSERGRSMWARVKGKTENDLLQLPFKAAWMFRPALIVPLHGIKSKTEVYRIFYAITGPLLPLLYRIAPKYVTTTEQVGRAMIKVAREGWPKKILENSDINSVRSSR